MDTINTTASHHKGECMKEEVVALVREIQGGNKEALSTLYELTYKDAYRKAYQLCRDSEDAKDAVQDTFLEISKSIYDLRDPECYYLWLSRIVTSKCTRIFRKKRHVTLDDEQMRKLPNQIDHVKEHSPELNMEETSEKQLMRKYISMLSQARRDAVDLVYLQQKSITEAAHILDIPEGTVKSRLFSARKDLERHLKVFEKEEGRQIGFYDAGSSFLMSTFLVWKSKVLFVKEKLGTMRKLTSITNNVVIGVATLSVTTLGITGAVDLYQENRKGKAEQVRETSIAPTKENATLPMKANFTVEAGGKVFTNPKAAYYEILRWGKDPSILTSKEKEDIKSVKPLYDALKVAQGPFWDRLQHEGWSEIFE